MTDSEPRSKRRWRQFLLDQLRQGVTPEKLALTLVLGVVLGIVPMLGTTTILCALAATALGLNLPAIQLVNGVVYPLQLILLIPFYRAGAWMFGADVSALSFKGVAALIRADVRHAIQMLWVVTMHALVAWFMLGAVIATVLYAALVPVLQRLTKQIRKRRVTA